MQKIYLKQSFKYRTIIYGFGVFIVSCIIGIYFRNEYLMYLGFFLVGLSIFYELKAPIQNIQSITIPNPQHNYFSIIIDNKESDFWKVKRHIVVKNWLYLYMYQEGSKQKLKIWLHKSNFESNNGIRDLAKGVIFA